MAISTKQQAYLRTKYANRIRNTSIASRTVEELAFEAELRQKLLAQLGVLNDNPLKLNTSKPKQLVSLTISKRR